MAGLADIAQGDEGWLVRVSKMRGWLTEDDNAPQLRPYVSLLWQILPQTAILSRNLCLKHLGKPPTSEKILKQVVKAVHTKRGDAPIRKPATVIFLDPHVHAALRNKLEDDKIRTKYWTEEENQGFGDDYVAEYSRILRDEGNWDTQLGTCKKESCLFLKIRPRVVLSSQLLPLSGRFAPAVFKGREIFSIKREGKGIRLFFIARPDADLITFGMETNPAELEHLFVNGERKTLDSSPDSVHRCLDFRGETEISFDDLDDAEKWGWRVAQPNGKSWPFPFVFKSDAATSMARPSYGDLEWFELALRGLSQIAKAGYTPVEDGKAKQHELSVPLHNVDNKVPITLVIWPSFEPEPIAEYYRNEEAKDKEKKQKAQQEVKKKEEQQKEAKKESFVYDPSIPTSGLACIVCGKKEEGGFALKRCGNCKKKLYCSADCQRKDWPTHKATCVKP